MFLMYVDESGDCGLSSNSPSKYYILSGLVIHELSWKAYLDEIINFRRQLKTKYGLKLREEFHAGKFINNVPKELKRIPLNDRLAMVRMFAEKLSSLSDFSVINVVINKQGKPQNYDLFEMAWKTLIQRFENTISNRNFTGPANPDEKGLIIPDRSDEKKLTMLLRKLRKYNPVPNNIQFGQGYRNIPIANIIEDPFFKNSANSLFTQAADLITYLLYQKLNPCGYMKKKSGHNYFNKLSPILCRCVSPNDPDGIVNL